MHDGAEVVRSASKQTYRIKEFAALTGVSVRALHHYDRIGLLKPRPGTSGYRLYGSDDVGVLEQIVALKFIGISLRDIKHCFEPNAATGAAFSPRSVWCSKRNEDV